MKWVREGRSRPAWRAIGFRPGGAGRRLCVVVALLAWLPAASGEDTGSRPEPASTLNPGLPNVVAPTLGGKQFWADLLFFHDWRIQQSALTGHCRLLDGKDYRHAWGRYEACRAALERIKQERGLPPMRGRGVLLLHGLGRSRSSMQSMAAYLRGHGYTAFNVSYPSTRGEISTHARRLAHIIQNLEGIESIDIVAHSLGNLVVRHYLRDEQDAGSGHPPERRLHRMVMLGPPNRGAELAEKIGRNAVFRLILGGAGDQLARRWKELQQHLATPGFEFGIIAGGRGHEKGFNPLLTGDDDLVVSVESTRLKGARDYLVLPVIHTFMVDDPAVQECTLRFLQKGYFISEEQRTPILE